MSDSTEWVGALAKASNPLLSLQKQAGPLPITRKPGGRLTGVGKEGDEAAQLWKAAKEFESIFLYQMIKQMRGTEKKEEMFHGGLGEDLFTEMMDEELAKKMAGRGGTGIAEMLFQQLSRQYGIGSGDQEPMSLPEPSGTAEILKQKLQDAQRQAQLQQPALLMPDF